MTDVEKLKARLGEITGYPRQMRAINADIVETAFFPGGKGLWNNEQDIFGKEFMILGQDFDTYHNYEELINNGRGEDLNANKTWRKTKELLDATEIKYDNCFFTNAIMGARETTSNYGKSPAFKDSDFIDTCREFFEYQLEIQKPKVIFVLGLMVAKFLSPLSEDLDSWKGIQSFVKMDNALNSEEIVVRKNVRFKNKYESTLVLLMHPSCRQFNLDKRKYKREEGNNAQIAMIKDAMKSLL